MSNKSPDSAAPAPFTVRYLRALEKALGRHVQWPEASRLLTELEAEGLDVHDIDR